MKKITSKEDLHSLKKKIIQEQFFTKEIHICGGPACLSYEGHKIVNKFNEKIKNLELEKEIRVFLSGCTGFCEKGPVVRVLPENTFYINVKASDVDEIIEKEIIKDERVQRLLYKDSITGNPVLDPEEIPFFSKQKKIVLRNCGIIDPKSIKDYLMYDGYRALEKALSMTQQEIVDEIKESGLRGRGGGGFPTGLKWQFALNNKADQKYVVCNADEGDPGAFMDRSILEGDPHSVIEAMIICGYAIGATKGCIYIRAEYPRALARLEGAIDQAKEYGFLGENILGSSFSFDIELKLGAGAFVCGEETSLIHSMEGNRGEPTTKPPFPAEQGYRGKPTNVNNVETFANITYIILNGAKEFRKIGTEKSPGTKVFSLTGKINNVGMIEVPMGTTLREVIYDIGGGIRNGKKFKALQTGGPSGGCLTEADLDTPIDYDNLIARGSMMGSGGMVVMDEDNCMVSLAKFYLEFSVDESCGKCTPCRIGNLRLLEILQKITSKKASKDDLDRLYNLCHTIKDTALCGLGQASPNPVLATLNKFRHEYLSYIQE